MSTPKYRLRKNFNLTYFNPSYGEKRCSAAMSPLSVDTKLTQHAVFTSTLMFLCLLFQAVVVGGEEVDVGECQVVATVIAIAIAQIIVIGEVWIIVVVVETATGVTRAVVAALPEATAAVVAVATSPSREATMARPLSRAAVVEAQAAAEEEAAAATCPVFSV